MGYGDGELFKLGLVLVALFLLFLKCVLLSANTAVAFQNLAVKLLKLPGRSLTPLLEFRNLFVYGLYLAFHVVLVAVFLKELFLLLLEGCLLGCQCFL